MLTASDLPDDIAALKALLLASERRVQERDDQVAGLEAQLNTRAAEIEHLKLWIAKLRRMRFGRKPRNWATRSSSWNCSWKICKPMKARW